MYAGAHDRSAARTIERLDIPLQDADIVCEAREDGMLVVRGVAAHFGSWYDKYWFRQQMAAGSWDRTLEQKARSKVNDIRGLWQHDHRDPLGRVANETLTLQADKDGLHFELVLNGDSPRHVSHYQSIKRRDVTAMSSSYRVVKDQWDKLNTNRPDRIVLEVEGIEISPVTWPANPRTSVRADAAALSYARAAGLDPARFHDATREDVVAAVRDSYTDRQDPPEDPPDDPDSHPPTADPPALGTRTFEAAREELKAFGPLP